MPSDNPIKVTKVVLVYDIEDLIEMENELLSMVEKKKRQLIKYEYPAIYRIMFKVLGAPPSHPTYRLEH